MHKIKTFLSCVAFILCRWSQCVCQESHCSNYKTDLRLSKELNALALVYVDLGEEDESLSIRPYGYAMYRPISSFLNLFSVCVWLSSSAHEAQSSRISGISSCFILKRIIIALFLYRSLSCSISHCFINGQLYICMTGLAVQCSEDFFVCLV